MQPRTDNCSIRLSIEMISFGKQIVITIVVNDDDLKDSNLKQPYTYTSSTCYNNIIVKAYEFNSNIFPLSRFIENNFEISIVTIFVVKTFRCAPVVLGGDKFESHLMQFPECVQQLVQRRKHLVLRQREHPRVHLDPDLVSI
jgi:hypothetical protein